jgi:hypothetical protein
MNQTATVQGQVTRTSGEPLAKAEVTLTRHEPFAQLTYATTSAAGGQFLLEGVEPGQYRLDVHRNGYGKETAGGDWFGRFVRSALENTGYSRWRLSSPESH